MIKLVHVSKSEMSGQEFGPIVFPHFDLLWVHRSSLRMRAGNNKYFTLTPGQGVLIFPNTEFEGVTKDLDLLASVHHFEIVEDLKNMTWPLTKIINKINDRIIFNTATLLTESLINRSVELNYNVDGGVGIKPIKNTYILLILQELFLAKKNTSLPLIPFKNLVLKMQKDLAYPWTLESMAKEADRPVSTFRHQFQQYFKLSPKRFLIHERMKEAARLLRETHLPVKQISFKVGYAELHHFYRNFKLFYKISPAKYRHTNLFKA